MALTAMTDAKICADCKWCKNGTFVEPMEGRDVEVEYNYRCIRVHSYLDVVTGWIVQEGPINVYCYLERNTSVVANQPKCGPEGKFWEARE